MAEDCSSCDYLCDILYEKLPSEQLEEAICSIRMHSLGLDTLRSLEKEEVAEVFPALGIRKNIMRIIEVSQPIRMLCCTVTINCHYTGRHGGLY